MDMNDFDSLEATDEQERWLRRLREGMFDGNDDLLDEFTLGGSGDGGGVGPDWDLDSNSPPLPHTLYLLCLNHTVRAHAHASDVAAGANHRNLTPSSSWATTSAFCNRSFPFLQYGQELFEEAFEMERIVSVVVPIIFSIIFIVGLFGNALVVIVVASNQQMRNTTNLLILNLAMADLLFIIFCVPFTATDYVLSYWPFGGAWCKIVQYVIIVTAYASVTTLVLMSADRFMAVVYPVTSISLRTDRNILLAIAVSWVLILVACSPALIAHGLEIHRYDYDEIIELCKFRHDYNQFIFQLIFLITSYAIPLLVICLLYCTMLYRLWKSVSSSTVISNQSLRGKKRVTRMVVFVVVMFALNWAPIHVVLVLKSLHRYDMTSNLNVTLQIAAHVLAYMNSCVNPILYAFLSDNFRKGFRKVIACNLGIDRVRNGLQGGGGAGAMGASFRRRRSSGLNGNVTIAEHHPPMPMSMPMTMLSPSPAQPLPCHGEGKEAMMLTTHCENGGSGRHSHRVIGANMKEAASLRQEDDIL